MDLKPPLNFNSSATLGRFTVRAIVFLSVKCCLRYWYCLLIKSVAPLMPIQSPCEESVWAGSFFAQFLQIPGLQSAFLIFVSCHYLFCPLGPSFPKHFYAVSSPETTSSASSFLLPLLLITSRGLVRSSSVC